MKKILPSIAIILFMILMLSNPSYYIQSATKGLTLFATTVLPALFPFYFCSLLLTKLGSVKTISKIAKKPTKFLYNAPSEGAYILAISMLSGYPVGASLTYELFNKNIINTEQAKRISSFASTSGPIFIIGTVGSAIFNNPIVGIILISSHYLGAILNGILYRGKSSKNQNNSTFKPLDTDNIMAECITNSTMSMLFVGGYIVIAGMLIDTLILFNLETSMACIMPENIKDTLCGIIYGIIEMTRGSLALSNLANLQLATALTSGIISFGGLSILLQTYTYLSKCKMNFLQVVLRKVTHSIIAFILAYLFSFGL